MAISIISVRSLCSFRGRIRLHTLLWSFILSAVFCFSPAYAQGVSASRKASFPYTARVKTDNVNVRAGQNNNYEVLAGVNKGDELVVVDKSYSWCKVYLPESARMYVKMSYTKLVSTQVGEITADRVNIRARANTTSSIIGQFVRGDQFFIRENSGEWLRIRPLAKAYGWVREDLIEFKSKAVPAKLFQDPRDAAVRAQEEKVSAERGRMARFAGLRSLAGGVYEAQGVLVKVAGEGRAAYKLMAAGKKGKGDVGVAYIEGPASMLMDFIGVKVVVRGAAEDDASLDVPVLNVTRIDLSL